MPTPRDVRRLLAELWLFAREHKAYWLVPLVIVLLAAGVVVVGSGAVAPFVYTLF
jgi:hypothetical protein